MIGTSTCGCRRIDEVVAHQEVMFMSTLLAIAAGEEGPCRMVVRMASL
jgi:hypothetical protein